MKYLIVGRSAAGKDTLSDMLQNEFGWKFVLSYSTRKPRYDGENTHKFVTAKEASNISSQLKAARTFIKNGCESNEYFATTYQIHESDAYIIDPFGVYQILCNMPDEQFSILYVYAESESLRINAAMRRGDKMSSIVPRFKDENKQFNAFESYLYSMVCNGMFFHNVKDVLLLKNDYKSDFYSKCFFRVKNFIEDKYPCAMRYLDAQTFKHCCL